MLSLIPIWGRLVALLALVAAIWGHGFYTAHHRDAAKYDALQAEYSGFKGNVAALGKAAEAQRVATESADKAKKEIADHENQSTIAVLRADNKRLRDASRASGSILPKAHAGARSPDSITFDRRLLEQALQRLDEGVSGLVGEGDEARVNLDTAKGWAKAQ